MEREKLISIIIPTYNMERYLAKCLNSLIIPELNNVEIIVVNDGSTDNSLAIAESFAEKYPDSFQIVNKMNGNYGSCINAALTRISGKYVKVLDSDDSFDSEMFSQYVRALSGCNEDLLLTRFTFITESGSYWEGDQFLSKLRLNETLSFEEVAPCIDYLSMHSVTYKSSLFRQFHYSQVEGVSFSDYQWLTIPMQYVKNVRYLGLRGFYRYLVGRQGQTTNPKLFGKQASNYISVFTQIIKSLNEIHSPEANRKFAENICAINLANIYRWTFELGDASITEQLAHFDEWLFKSDEGIYDRLGYSPYFIAFRRPLFKFIRDFRRTQRRSDYRIPHWVNVSKKSYDCYLKIRHKLIH